MPSDRTPADREPARDADGVTGAGSVVVGADPASPAGVALLKVRPAPAALAERMDAVGVLFSQLGPVVQRVARDIRRSLEGVRIDPPMSEYDAGDAMCGTPPADGEETSPCPA